MGKLLIREVEGSQPVPFLRGILTKSLQDAGLSFVKAYKLASDIRQELAKESDDEVITSEDLRALVVGRLRKEGEGDAAERFSSAVARPATIFVVGEDRRTPFSRAQHQRGLEPCGLSEGESGDITGKVYEDLLRRGVREISSDKVRSITCRHLEGDVSQDAADRYMAWTEFVRSSRPLLLLIGGAPGCGKSTIATELAHRLDIVRIQSTDMLREVMRMMVPQRLLPALHTSSFCAWEVLPMSEDDAHEPDVLLANGYRTQAELLSVACEGAIQRALQERVSLILEGVHIDPLLLSKLGDSGDAVIVPVMLGVLKPDELKRRLKGRGKRVKSRKAARYLDHFDAIWELQSFLLSEADRASMNIVPNGDKEGAVQQIMRAIIDKIYEQQR